MIDLKKVEECSKKIYEDMFEISILQEDLESKLNEIYENSVEFERGKISKNTFASNEAYLKKCSTDVIKKIKELIKSNLGLTDIIRKEIQNQETKARNKKVIK